MSFIMYCLLRRFFVKLSFGGDAVTLSKGILIVRTFVMPYSSVIRVTFERSLPLRLFKMKKVVIFAVRGKITFFLRESENIPFLPQKPSSPLKTTFPQRAFGAFISTRALAGIAFAVSVIRRIGSIFGSDYYERAVNVLFTAAEKLREGLMILHVAVPPLTAALGTAALAGWLFAYLKDLAETHRFRVSRRGDLVFVSSGFITLYDHALVLNSPASAAEARDSFVSAAVRRSPIYLHGVMLHPCVALKDRRHFLGTFCGIAKPRESSVKLTPPPRAFFGYCAAPVLRAIAFAVGIRLSGALKYAELLRAVLWGGFAASVYTVLVSLVYMRRSGIARFGNYTEIAARKSMRLHTAYVRDGSISSVRLSTRRIFRSPLCSCELSLSDRSRRKVRGLPIKHIFK